MSFNITGILDGSAGSAQSKVGQTVQTFIISLASGFVLFSVQFIIFLVIRVYPWAKRIYQPRAFLVPLKNRLRPPPNSPFKWIVSIFKTPNSVLLEKSGMDGYFFIRYLSMCLKMFFPMAVIIIPILTPLNAIGGKGNNVIAGASYNVSGLDTLAWSNVSPEHTNRYWAHLVLAIGVIVWACYLFHRELTHYIKKRQEYLSFPGHRLKASATSVLITDIPSDMCTVEKLTEHYDDFPGGLRRIWINRNFTPLVKKAAERDKIETILEGAETNLIRRCIKMHRKQMKHQAPDSATSGGAEEDKELQSMGEATGDALRTISRPQEGIAGPTTPEICQLDLQYDIDTKALWTAYVSPSKRQKTRIPRGDHTILFKIPLLGRFFSSRVDTIYYCRRELARMNVEVEQEMDKVESYPAINCAFLQFNTQKAAHLACQGLAHPLPRAMSKRTIELAPGDINWPNLGLLWWQRYLRLIGFLALFLFLIFVFGIISAFTGILSRVNTLGGTSSWLNWINSLPSWLVSFIQGTLPPVIVIVVLSGPLPIFLRMFTNDIRGSTTGTQGERSLQLWYFIFLLFELFIVPTITSGLTSVAKEIVQNPVSIPNILATNLPTAANYYFSFLIVEALSISASSILQTIRLLNYYVLGSTNSPDSVFNSLTFTNRTRIGSNIPWYTTYAVIGLVYSVIAPLMLLFMLVTFSLFWFVIKNNILYVIRTGNVDGGGLWFPEAINQTFTGLYFMEACLLGLFFLVRDTAGNVACDAQGIIMAFALFFTVCYQWWLTSTFHPLSTYLPVTMEGDAQQRDREYELERLNARKDAQPSKTRDDDSTEEFPMAEEATTPPLERNFSSSEKAPQTDDFSNTNGKSSDFSNRTTIQSAAPRASVMQARQQRDEHSAKRILARLNRPLDERRLLELEHTMVEAERAVGNHLVPRRADVEQQMLNDPISKIIMQHNDELEDLDPEERDLLISVAFTHPILRETRPSVWIPQDTIGVSDDEVKRTRELSKEVVIDNKGAFFDKKLKVQVDRPPPDMSEFALLMAEL